jgi:hypothetical protein
MKQAQSQLYYIEPDVGLLSLIHDPQIDEVILKQPQQPNISTTGTLNTEESKDPLKREQIVFQKFLWNLK